MQINAYNSSLTTVPPRPSTSVSQQQQTKAHHSYSQNASAATIIDAEFVEISGPAKDEFIRERQELDIAMVAETKKKMSQQKSQKNKKH